MADDVGAHERSIFLAALEHASGRDRESYLKRACAGQPELLERIRVLLTAHDASEGPLDRLPQREGDTLTVDSASLERPGTQIGPYKLLQQIGEGGFGEVYLAEQHAPVRRKVALKIVKPGMDTHEIVARFEAERQALAMMDHPNIAQVLGAGTTDRGRPYFAMELVRGVPITEYCDTHNLSMRERLDLFFTVCHAVQHAHQKGIIHRDIKPSNILVAMHDGNPVPKVIDFGVAKALNQQLTEKTLFTAYGQMIGTPQYMSPEQAEMSGLDIDTRSDVYALGVLLYELLTGTTPLDPKRLRAAGYAEMQRIIREEEPAKPSHRVSTLGERATFVAQHRKVDVGRLQDQLAGELDWIVMKSLEKERGRRYETANAFAQDIDNYLRDEPVSACPPSATYRLRKLIRRNRTLVTLGATISVLLVAVTVLNLALTSRASRAELLAIERRERESEARGAADASRRREAELRKQAVEQRDTAVAAEKEAARQRELAVTAESQAQANLRQARQAVDRYLATIRESPLLVDANMRPLRSQLLASARVFYQSIVDKQSDADLLADVAASHFRLGQIHADQGNTDAALAALQLARTEYEKLDAARSGPELRAELAEVCLQLGEHARAIELCEAQLASDAQHAPSRRVLARTFVARGMAHQAAGRMAEALADYDRARQAMTPLATVESPAASDLAELCVPLIAAADLEEKRTRVPEALACIRAAAETAERAVARDPHTARYGELLATLQRRAARLLCRTGQVSESLASYRQTAEKWSKLAFEYPAQPRFKAELVRTWHEWAAYQAAQNRPEDAARIRRQADQYLAGLPRSLNEDFFQLAVVHACLATTTNESAQPTPPDHQEQVQNSVRQAIESLREAFQRGYRPAIVPAADPVFSHLATNDDFRAVAASFETASQPGETIREKSNGASGNIPDLALRIILLASLRGIAESQIALEQSDEAKATLEQSLTQLDELARQSPRDTALLAEERGQVMYAFGYLYWQMNRYPDARQAWDTGYELLESARSGNTESERIRIGRVRAHQERDLIDHYGLVGAWKEAAKHRERHLSSDRVASATLDPRYSFVTRLEEDRDSFDEACRSRVEQYGEDDPAITAWLLSMGEQSVLEGPQLVELATKSPDAVKAGNFHNVILGICQRRAGLFELAARNCNLDPRYAFDRTMALFQAGHEQAARECFQWADSAYAARVRAWLGSRDLLLPDSDFRGSSQWWELLRLQIMRREACQVLSMPVEDPWAKLLEAREALILGNASDAERAWEAAVTMSPTDASVWVARAETHAVFKQYESAERYFSHALGLEPEDAQWWIARGKHYLERGLDTQADADYQRAAELSPDDLDLFLRTGVWAMGPYPATMNQSYVPEVDPHPAKRLATQAVARDAVTMREWTRLPSSTAPNAWGTIVMTPVTQNTKDRSAYVLSFIYASEPRTTSIMVASAHHLRIWCNGTCVADSPQSTEQYDTLERIPVSLRRGRNVILVRIHAKTQDCRLVLRLSDSPIERALHAARLLQWKEAVAAFESVPRWQLTLSNHYSAIYFKCLAALGASEAYDAAVQFELRWRRWVGHDVISLLRGPTVARTSSLTRDDLLAVAQSTSEVASPWMKIARLRALLRAGEPTMAIDYFRRHADIATDLEAQMVIAMAHHQRGEISDATTGLEKVQQQYVSWVSDRLAKPGYAAASPYGSPPALVAMLAEANRMIRNVDLQQEPQSIALREKIAVELTTIRSELSDFDLAVMFRAEAPRIRLLRGLRLAELSRWDEAEADFAKATELAPDDAFLWLAIGKYWLGKEQVAKASEAFGRSLDADRTQAWAHEVQKLLSDNEPLLVALLESRPRDAQLWSLRSRQLCAAERWPEAVQAQQRLTEVTESEYMIWYQLAVLQAAAGNSQGYRDACRQLLERFGDVDAASDGANFVAWSCALAPGACDDYTRLLDLARRHAAANVVTSTPRKTLGAALLRAGRVEEAIAELLRAEKVQSDEEVEQQTSPAYGWYLLAIAYGQQRQTDLARQWYEKGKTWVAKALDEQRQAKLPPWAWNRRLTLELLEREAAQAVGQSVHEPSAESEA